jgi:NAD(P)-dependent dehydrogenase (short-subunit alcohol dehydrogenase family)
MPLTQSLNRNYGADNICINAIRPGQIDTPMLRGGLQQGKPGETSSRYPSGPSSLPTEIAHGILFLASDWTQFVSGTELRLSLAGTSSDPE